MYEQRVKDLGVVHRRCGSCDAESSLRIVETRTLRRRGPGAPTAAPKVGSHSRTDRSSLPVANSVRPSDSVTAAIAPTRPV